MLEFRTKINESGRLVIPAPCRRQLRLSPGEEVIIRIENEELRLFTLKHSLKKAQALVHKYVKGRRLTDKLKEMRQEDAKNEW